MKISRGAKLGNGHYSNVYSMANDKDKVVKYASKLDGTYHFYEWILESKIKSNKYPRVHHLAKRKNGGYVVVLDKLQECFYYNIAKSDIKRKNYYKTLNKSFLKFLEEKYKVKLSDVESADANVEGVGIKLDDHEDNYMYNPKNKSVVLTDPFCGLGFRKPRSKK